ncbi:MAG: tetratricopeptide repeat protein [Deltaproteobacteria bacterium]
MKTKLLLLFLCLSIAGTGCKKKEKGAEYQGTEGAVNALQDTSRMEGQYKDVIAKDPKNYDAIVALGNLYFDTGQTEKSIEMYQKALELNPNDVNVRTDMGTMYRKMGNSDKAIEEFRKSTTINPKHEMSWYNLGTTLYYDKKDLRGAADAWEHLLNINPYYPDAEELKQIISQAKNPQPSEPKSPSSGWVK